MSIIVSLTSDDLFKNEQDRNRYGKVIAGRTLASMRDDTHITIDMGGGYGSGMYEYIVETIQGEQSGKSSKRGDSD